MIINNLSYLGDVADDTAISGGYYYYHPYNSANASASAVALGYNTNTNTYTSASVIQGYRSSSYSSSNASTS